jgi:rod shape-determining protein MreD
MIDYLRYAGLLIILIILQKLIDWLLPVTSLGITPDVVLIGLVYLSIKEGKIPGTVSGFLAGLIIDILSFSFLGLAALSKSSAGFFAGFFNDEDKLERYYTTYVFVLIVFGASLINNSIYFLLYFQGTNLGIMDIFIRYIITTSLYTSFVSVFVIFLQRKSFIGR